MGPALCLFSAACFGAMPIFGKLAYQAGVAPGALLLMRFTLAAALLGALLVVRPQLRAHRPAQPLPAPPLPVPHRPRAGVVLAALCLGAIGYAGQAAFYFAAFARVDATLVV